MKNMTKSIRRIKLYLRRTRSKFTLFKS